MLNVRSGVWLGVEVLGSSGIRRMTRIVEAGVRLPFSSTLVFGYTSGLERVRADLFVGGPSGLVPLGAVALVELASTRGPCFAELRVDLTTDGRVLLTLTDRESAQTQNAILPLPRAFLTPAAPSVG